MWGTGGIDRACVVSHRLIKARSSVWQGVRQAGVTDPVQSLCPNYNSLSRVAIRCSLVAWVSLVDCVFGGDRININSACMMYTMYNAHCAMLIL